MSKPVRPVMPAGLEFLVFYTCPHCHKSVGVLSPVQPMQIGCSQCGFVFPIVPVDERSIQYMRLMTGNGRSLVESDFL